MDQQIENNDKKWQAIAWQIGGTATAWVVVPALVAVFGGQWLDTKFQTEPLLFIISMTLAFIVTLIGILRLAQDYLKQQEQEDEEDKKI